MCNKLGKRKRVQLDAAYAWIQRMAKEQYARHLYLVMRGRSCGREEAMRWIEKEWGAK